jgi:acetyl esterase/lipase
MAGLKGTAAAKSTDDVIVSERRIKQANGQSLRVLVLRPKIVAKALPGFVHFHPGGWVAGVPEMSLTTLLSIAAEISCIIVSVDYRLAPEHPFPAAFEDGLAALAWIDSEHEQLGVDPTRIGLLGESAGATIAAGLALHARDHGRQNPLLLQSLVYPPLDDRAALDPPHPFAGSIGLDQSAARFAWQSLLQCDPGQDGVSSFASPNRSACLDNLPPTFLAVGSLDPFLEENMAFAARLLRDGVRTELLVLDGAPHGFDRVEGAEVTRCLRAARISWLKRTLATANP